MHYAIKIILTAFAVAIFIGCQSSVRFSSTTSSGKNHNRNIASNSKTSNEQSVDYSDLSLVRKKIISIASSYIGFPYCYGGYATACFDCSGFVKTVFESVDINLPRVSRDIFNEGVSISNESALPGDLVFFSEGKEINHVGIFIGNREMIHASTSSGVIRQSINSEYFSSRIAGFRKYIN